MEDFFEKYRWAIHLGLVAFSAVLLALALNQSVAIWLAPFTVPQLPSMEIDQDRTAQVVPRTQRNWSRVVKEKCLFGCPDTPEEAPTDCPDGCDDGEECQEGICVAVEMEEISSDLPVASDLPVKLMGAMVAASPQWSLALLQDNQGQTYIVGIGDFLMGEAEVLEIFRDRILIERNRRIEFIRMEDSITGNPAATPRTPARPAPARPTTQVDRGTLPDVRASAPTVRGQPETVRQVAENSFVIQRDALEEALGDPQRLAQQGQIVPNYRDGENHGIKLIGVTSNSVYSQIGIRSGDVILGINGRKIQNQNQALEMLQGLRGAAGAQIEVERRGERQQIEYKVE